MIRRLGHRFEGFFRATTPDPFVLAVGLTLVVFLLAAVVEGQGPVEIIAAWQGDTGFFSLLAFTMQMVLILVTGHALASAPRIRAALSRIARIPKSGAQAAFLVAFVAILTSILNWGLGLVVGAILAREVGKSAAARGVRVHYPLLTAAGYTGLMCWHGGFSGTAPLMMTTEANVARFLGDDLAAEVGTLSLTQTVLSPMNLIATLGMLAIIPALCAALAPRGDEPSESLTDYLGPSPEEKAEPDIAKVTWPERIEASPITCSLIVVPLGAAFIVWLRDVGIEELDPNALNLLFLTLGLALHGSLARYRLAVADAVRGTSGIILQFPFYAGIMGVMRGTGLGATFASAVTSAASPQSYGVLTMLSAGVINLFVPSGGGQWAVQGPIAVEASEALGVPLAEAVMAVAYGDQLTNMLQPFWALPLLAITGVRARDMIGYTAIVMIAGGIWMATVMLLW
jgi:short-chain fatty acids transporter